MEPKPVGALWLGWTNCSTLSQSPGTTLRPKLKSAVIFFASNQIEKTPCVSEAFVQKNYSTVNLAPRKSAWQKFRVKQLQGGRVYYFQWSKSATHNPWIVSSTGSSQNLDLLSAPRGICSSQRCVRYHRTLILKKWENMAAACSCMSLMPGSSLCQNIF